MAHILLDDVSKRYGDVLALDRVSLEIGAASFTSILGPPGAGKSVLLRVLLGLEPVDSGRIVLDGRDVTHAAPRERNFAMVFQNLALFPHLSALDNIRFPLVRNQVSASAIAERVQGVSAVLGIGHILHKRPAALSGGERQRVAIGRALVRDAAAYLLDEPISALDARLRDTMRVELKRLQAELGHTFVYVTHDHEEAMSVADRMAVLDRGRVIQVADPDTIYAGPATLRVAELAGSPGINVLQGRVTAGVLDGPHGRLPVAPGPARWHRDKQVYAAVRPEAVTVAPGSAEAGLDGVVADVEMLGGFGIASVRAGDVVFRAIIHTAAGLRPAMTVRLLIPAASILFFDGQTGHRLCPAIPEAVA